mgnify:CR=1 FL=1
MPLLRNAVTGELEFVADSQVQESLDSGEYAIDPEHPVQMTALEGQGGYTSPEQIAALRGTRSEAEVVPDPKARAGEKAAYEKERFSGIGETGAAFTAGVLDAVTLGGFSALNRLGEGPDSQYARSLRQHETAHTVGEVAGSLLPGGPAARVGRSLSKGGGVGRAAVGYGAEGGLRGAGTGVAQVSMSEDPLPLERAISTISSNALLGAGIGGAAGVVGKVAEKGLARARRAVDASVSEAEAGQRSIAEVGSMDRTELRAAKEAEIARVEAEELVPARAQLAQDIAAHRDTARGQKPWIALEGLKKGEQGSRELRVIGSDYLAADKKLDRLLRDPKTMAEEPWLAKKALREEEAALLNLKAARPEIEARIAGPKAVPVAASPAPGARQPLREVSPGVFDVGAGQVVRLEARVNVVPPSASRSPIQRSVDEPVEFVDVELLGDGDYIAGTYGPTNFIGKAEFEIRGDQLYPHNVEVDPAFQRRGLASKMYAKAEQMTGKRVVPGRQTKDGAALSESFRARRDASGVPGPPPAAIVGSRRIPSWEKLTAERRVVRTVPFEDIEPHLISIEGTIPGRMESIREGVKKGSSITDMGRDLKKPIDVTVLPSGKLFVEDGRHRLRVAAEMAAAGKSPKLRVRFSKGVAGAEENSVAMFPEALARRSVDADTRLQALSTVDGLLESNAALQARIAQLTPQRLGGPKLSSERLEAILRADDVLQGARTGRSLAEDATTTYAISAAMGALPGGPAGAVLAMGARKGLRKISDWVFGRMGKASAAAEQRTARALSALVGAGEKVARTAPPLASRVLSRVSFGGDEEPAIREQPTRKRLDGAVVAFLAREKELRSQTQLGEDGKIHVTPAARERIAERLKGVGAVDPLAADAMETQAVRRIEYLATKLPKRPDMGHMSLGPEKWVPNTMEVRAFARIVSALEDPGGVEERMVTGMLTPDEAEAYREVYPERWADLTKRIIEGVSEMKKPLTRAAKLGLTIMTGVPWDPALSPPILKVLQSVHLQEEGSEGGEQAPRAQPQYGSITREQPTSSQKRSEV